MHFKNVSYVSVMSPASMQYPFVYTDWQYKPIQESIVCVLCSSAGLYLDSVI